MKTGTLYTTLYLNRGHLLRLTEEDRLTFAGIPRTGPGSRSRVQVTDQATGLQWLVARASCGLKCRCAAQGRTV